MRSEGAAPGVAAPGRGRRAETPLASRHPGVILVVDDDSAARSALRRSMEAMGHEVLEAVDGMDGLSKLTGDVDLVLVDQVMPQLDGFGFVERMRRIREFDATPVIMVTGHDSRDERLQAVATGINDFIAKPFDLLELRLRSEAQLKLKAARDAVQAQRDSLEREVMRRTAALRLALEEVKEAGRRERRAHLATIRALVLAAEYKDDDTAAHISRIAAYSEIIARGAGLPEGESKLIGLASPLHDVGKIGIPDSILLKPGPLTEPEWEVMRRHPEIGARILETAEGDVLRLGRVIALTHHERWDGSGYPRNLAGDAIPVEGRICAIADVFDALTSDRKYRSAMPNGEVYDLMRDEAGQHFDPDLLSVFFDQIESIEETQRRFRPR
ncbi:MAG: HD domain-containing phosphohydrolase [Gemmatimonadota bacterium]